MSNLVYRRPLNPYRLARDVQREGNMALLSTMAVALAIVAGIGLVTIPTAAQSWRLITPQEEARDDVAPHNPSPPDRSGSPTIDLLRPDLSRPIRNPTTIELQF